MSVEATKHPAPRHWQPGAGACGIRRPYGSTLAFATLASVRNAQPQHAGRVRVEVPVPRAELELPVEHEAGLREPREGAEVLYLGFVPQVGPPVAIGDHVVRAVGSLHGPRAAAELAGEVHPAVLVVAAEHAVREFRPRE